MNQPAAYDRSNRARAGSAMCQAFVAVPTTNEFSVGPCNTANAYPRFLWWRRGNVILNGDRHVAPWFVMVAVGLSLSACTSLGHQARHGATDERSSDRRDAAALSHEESTAKDEHSVRQASENHAQRLADAIARRSSSDDGSDTHPPSVQWLRWAGSQKARQEQLGSEKPLTPLTDGSIQSTEPPEPSNEAQPPPAPVREGLQADRLTDRRWLLAQLRKTVRTGAEPAIDKAIAAASLSLASPDRTLEPADLEPLNPAQRRLVRRYHELIVTLSQELGSGDGQLDVDAILERIAGLWGQRPIRINHIELCRRVRGYGVYEPFESRVFMAGREQPMIIYAELKRFAASVTANDRYEVKLAQQVVLYNESDGLVVWRQPKVDILDESRNRRHDFFVVQMIRLPAQLNVGKYLLKVRITDRTSESVDEATIPIQLVADQSLVAGRSR